MEYVVPLLIMLVVVIAVVVGARLLGRRRQSGGNPVPGSSPASGPAAGGASRPRGGREATREDAAAASAKLSPEEHRAVYAMIAQHQVLNAVREYRKATQLGFGESAAAVAALAQFPQPTPERPAAATPLPESEPTLPDLNVPLTVDDIMKAAPTAPASSAEPQAAAKPVAAAGSYRYRAIVSRGDEIREVASTRLNEEIFAAIKGLARSGDHDGAARLLLDHSDIGPAEAQEFVALIGPED